VGVSASYFAKTTTEQQVDFDPSNELSGRCKVMFVFGAFKLNKVSFSTGAFGLWLKPNYLIHRSHQSISPWYFVFYSKFKIAYMK